MRKVKCDFDLFVIGAAPYAPYLEELVGLAKYTKKAVKSGELAIQEAADTVCNAVKNAALFRHDSYHWGGPGGNCDFDGEVFRQMCIDWGQNSAPDYIREGVCNYTAPWIPNNAAAMEEMNKIKAHQLVRKERLAKQGVIVPDMMDAEM